MLLYPKTKVKKSLIAWLLPILLLGSTAVVAQNMLVKKVADGGQSAGFKFSADEFSGGVEAEPVITYQQNIQMLSSVADKPTLKIYGNGRVLVHNPVYMKSAGDYEMQLNETELMNLVSAMSGDGLMDFDKKKIKQKMRADLAAMKKNGQLFAISDGVENIVDIRLDEYQKNKSSQKVKGFYKQIKWKNIEHDAARFKQNEKLVKATRSISRLKTLMKDTRLTKRVQK